jgi:hypothetical protein
MRFLPKLVAFAVSAATIASASPALAQLDVYNNQGNFGPTSSGFGSVVTMWDDLQLTQGGLLSEISFIARRPTGAGLTASGFIDLRLFDETFNRPQGDPLGVIPFNGTFELDPTDTFGRRLVIELTDLEPLEINLPTVGRIGAGIRFDNTGWFFPDAGQPEVGTSPGGNWLDSSFLERSDAGGDMAWRVAIADPTPTGPGVGTYNLFETALATPDHPTSNSFGGANDEFFRGVGFRVERTTEISRVGAFVEGSGTVFAAIVAVDGLYGAPDPADLSGDDVIATALIDLTGANSGADHAVELDATLEPGYYSLVIGSGKFGADGDASIRFGHIPNGEWTPYGLRQSDGQQFFSIGGHRFFVEAKSAPGTLQLRPTFDALAEVTFDEFYEDPQTVRLIDGDPDIVVDIPAAAADPTQIAVFEFPLDDLPENREIRSVNLQLDVWFANSGTTFDVFGFAGNGTPGAQDAVGQQLVVGQTNISSTGITTIQIDPAFVRSLAGTATHLGLTIVPEEIGAFGFETLENGQFGEPPLLTINLGPVEATLAGDFNDDGIVDAVDYTVWRNHLGEADEANLHHNGDGDDVGPTDYDLWKLHYGKSSDMLGSGGLSLAAVPEPSTIALLSLFALAASAATRRPRSNAVPGKN